jgi:hypothetical protein
MEVIVVPIRRQLVNALIHKWVIVHFVEPDEWFCFSCTAMSSIINPDTLALSHKLEYYANEAIQEDSPMPGCPVSTALGT